MCSCRGCIWWHSLLFALVRIFFVLGQVDFWDFHVRHIGFAHLHNVNFPSGPEALMSRQCPRFNILHSVLPSGLGPLPGLMWTMLPHEIIVTAVTGLFFYRGGCDIKLKLAGTTQVFIKLKNDFTSPIKRSGTPCLIVKWDFSQKKYFGFISINKYIVYIS